VVIYILIFNVKFKFLKLDIMKRVKGIEYLTMLIKSMPLTKVVCLRSQKKISLIIYYIHMKNLLLENNSQ